MNNQVDKPKTVDESIIDHLRQDFGRIMTDEQLAKIFETAIDKILFQPRYETDHGTFSSRQVKKPSLIEQAISDVLEPKVMDHVKKILAENPEKIQEAIEKSFGNPEELIMQAIGGFVQNAFDNAKWEIQTNIQNGLGINV